MPRSARAILDAYEADDFAYLLECRWSKQRRDEVLPVLTRLLRHRDREIRHRGMWNIHRIGYCFRKGAMKDVVPIIVKNMDDSDDLTRRIATSTLIAVGADHPSAAVPALIRAAEDPERLEPALQALMGIGPRARTATPVFLEATRHKQARIRRLALRGLMEVATKAQAEAALEHALDDRSRPVRETAAKLLQKP